MVAFPGFANIYLKAMEVCKTDIQNLIRLLDKSAELIDKYCKKPCEQDKARQCRKTSKKLKKKIKNEDITNQWKERHGAVQKWFRWTKNDTGEILW